MASVGAVGVSTVNKVGVTTVNKAVGVTTKAVWYKDEIGATACTLFPLGVVGLGWYCFSKSKGQDQWFKSLKKPSWVIENPQICAPLELAVIAPIGYAAHRILKEASGEERQIAICLYGAGLVTWVISIPAFTHTRELKCWFAISTLGFGIFGATAYAFYKIDNTAGWLLAPLVAWCAYGALSMGAMMEANPTNGGADWAPKE